MLRAVDIYTGRLMWQRTLTDIGKFYDIPVTSDSTRYREKQSTDPKHGSDRARLQKILDEFMAIKQEYGKPKSQQATKSP